MAKLIKFNLTLSGATVSTFDDLQDHFSAEILPIYRSGRLLKWLQARELTEQVQAVQAMTTSEDDSEQLGALCRALGLDDDAEVITFLLEDWQANQARQAAAQAAPTPQATTQAQVAEAEEDAGGSAPAVEPVNWSGQNMSGRNFEGADLRNGIFKETNFEECNFNGADLSGANLEGANLTNAKGTKAIFLNANLSKATLTGCKFVDSSFEAAIFSQINVPQTDTYRGRPISNMYGCFEGCSMIKTKFSHVNIYIDSGGGGLKFSRCNFEGADLSFSRFTAYSMGGHNLYTDACNFSQANVLGVMGVEKHEIDKMTNKYQSIVSK